MAMEEILPESLEDKEEAKPASVPSLKLPTPELVTKTVEKARVLFSYEPEQDDELKLVVGEILTLTNKDVFDGWMEGELNGKRGIFPDNFVEMLPPEQIKIEASEANKPIQSTGSVRRAAKSPPTSPGAGTQEPMKLPEPLIPETKGPAPQPHKGVSILPPGGLIGIGPGSLKKTDHSKKDAARPPPPETTKKPAGKGPAPAPPALSTKPKPALPVAPKPSKPVAPKPGAKTPDESSVPGFLRTPSVGSSMRSASVPAKHFLNKDKDSTDGGGGGPPKPVFPRANSLSRPPAAKAPARTGSTKSQDDHAPLVNGNSEHKSDDIDLDAVKPTEQLKGVQRIKGPTKNPPSKYTDKKKKQDSTKATNTNKEPGPARPSPPQNVNKSETVSTTKDAKPTVDETDNGMNNAAASAFTKAAFDESAKEISSLKSQVSDLETKMAEMEKRFKKLLLGVTDDLESERKQRMNQQIEIDSLRKKLDILGN